jgi:lipopolysaccharide/colanic/teichoic acid biosynthesis glycosyltransferase
MHVGSGGDVGAVDQLNPTASAERAPLNGAGAVVVEFPRVVVDVTDDQTTVVEITDGQTTIDQDESELSLVKSGLLAAGMWALATKRIIDIVGSSLLLVLLSPLMCLVATAILVTSGGPIFYVQQRVGRNGDLFRFYKFRSMVNGAHQAKQALLAANEVTGPVFKIKDDPRVTPLGRILRRLSLDELPQLWNVLIGTMSLVGPRPSLPEEAAVYTERERQRLLARPGLTCIWQVSGRSEVEFANWIEMDIQYITNWTIRLDLQLLLATLPAVLAGKGAY